MALKYNDSSRVITEQKSVFLDSLTSSPVLVRACGASLIAGAAISGGRALCLILLVTLLLVTVGLVSAIDGDRISAPLRPVVYTAVAVVILELAVQLLGLIDENFVNSLGIYAPLIAFSSIVLVRTEPDSPMLTAGESVTDALALAATFAALALPVALVRELLAGGTIFGLRIFYGGLASMNYPFAGFILVGFAIAGLRALLRLLPERSESQ